MKFFLCLLLLCLSSFSAFAESPEKESTLDRVKRTGILRCGYLPYEPFLIKDVNTGKMSGLMVQYFEAVGQKQNLKIEWSGEVNIDQIVPALESGRFDAFCVPCSPDSAWEKVLDFPAELGALPYYVYVGKDRSFTPEQLQAAKFATVDGFALTEITHDNFPNAEFLSLPQTTSPADMYNQLRFKKADAHVNEDISAQNYMKHNPSVIRRYSDTPLVAVRMYMVSRKGDDEMYQFLDKKFSTETLENQLLMKEMRKKYGVEDSTYLIGDQCKKKETTGKGGRVCLQ